MKEKIIHGAVVVVSVLVIFAVANRVAIGKQILGTT